MTAATLDGDIKLVGGRKKWPGANIEVARRFAGPIVHAVDFLNIPPRHHVIFAHLARTTATFFGGLKNYNKRPVKITRFSKIFCCPK